MTEYIMRLDDAAHHAEWGKWDRVEHLLESYGVRPLVGVIPNCMDTAINAFDEITDFWGKVHHWEGKGWEIGMHGYNHVYISEDGGVNPVNHKSEFAGIDVEIQKQKIREGVRIFRENGIVPQVFFAPAHTMDINTIRALKEESGICIISDTIANRPYRKWGMTFVPQQSGRVRRLFFRTVTFCYHPNMMGEDDFQHLEAFLRRWYCQFVPFPTEVCGRKRSVYDWLLEKSYLLRRQVTGEKQK